MKPNKEELRKRRKGLECLAEEGKLYCEKHQMTVTRPIFYHKRCYIGREGNKCKYLVSVREDER